MRVTVLTIVGHDNLTFKSSDVHPINAIIGATTVHNAITKKVAKLAFFQAGISSVSE